MLDVADALPVVKTLSDEAKVKHPPNQVLLKFVALLFVLLSYFGYLVYEYDLLTGGIAALITWSFFVLCTPFADAGFLLDFPIRLIFGLRMILSEIVVWGIAILINIICLTNFNNYYETTVITKLMKAILSNPYPYWIVIVLSGIGTFLSIRFGDELLDVLKQEDRVYYLKHHFKHEILLFIFFFLVIFGYYEVVKTLGLNL